MWDESTYSDSTLTNRQTLDPLLSNLLTPSFPIQVIDRIFQQRIVVSLLYCMCNEFHTPIWRYSSWDKNMFVNLMRRSCHILQTVECLNWCRTSNFYLLFSFQLQFADSKFILSVLKFLGIHTLCFISNAYKQQF